MLAGAPKTAGTMTRPRWISSKPKETRPCRPPSPLHRCRGRTRRSERGNYAVILASGAEDGGKRATLALSAACTAQAMDLTTILFLGDGVHWGYEGRAEEVHAAGFPPLADLMETSIECGGQVFLCSACDAFCALPSHADGTTPRRRRDVRPQGLAAVLSHTVGGGSLTL
jgi:predicted peroxiredoxin